MINTLPNGGILFLDTLIRAQELTLVQPVSHLATLERNMMLKKLPSILEEKDKN